MAMNVNDLNSSLRGELAAVDTYRQALDKSRTEYGQDPKFEQLSQMMRDHQEAADQLQQLISQHGGKPDTSSGAWGAWSNTVMGAARLFGDRSALKALKEGEESGIKQYQSVLDDEDVPTAVKSQVQELMELNRQHVRQLDQMIDVVATA